MQNDDNKNVRIYKNSVIFKRLIMYIKPYMLQFFIALGLTILLVAADLVPSWLLGEVVGILQNDSLAADERLSNVLLLFGVFVLIIVISTLINYFNTMLLQKTGQKIVLKLREEIFVKIEGLSINQINNTPVGKWVTRVTSDINMINELYTNVFVNLIRYILTFIFVYGVMLFISPILTLYLSILIPIILVLSIIFNMTSKKQYRKVRGSVSNVNAFLSENLSGMKLTQVFNQEEKKLIEFKERNDELKRNSIKQIIVFGIFRPAIYVLYVICQIIVLYNGYNLVVSGIIGSNKLVTYHGYIQTFFNPIQQLADQFNNLQSAFASAERVFAVLDTKKEILDEEDAIEIEHFDGEIEFKNVWFAYNPGVWILKDVSFKVNSKETVAFVGATGAGKTTILALIVRNYEINSGSITIDGIDIKHIKIESLRRHIGQMLQDVFLFSGSIRNNITLREESFTDEDIIEACSYVNADKFISKLDGGIDYKVLERGQNFSSGQRQLLSFARTIIHKPNIMILDEATANIDTETEVLIQDSLEKMRNVGTMLIVAHRLSTIQHADKIIVLHKGEIKEMGNHQELLALRGLYYNLYELQYKKK